MPQDSHRLDIFLSLPQLSLDLQFLFLAKLPLLLAALVIWRLRDSGEELQTLNQVLIQELVAEEPRLLPRPESSERRRRLAGSRAASEDPPF